METTLVIVFTVRLGGEPHSSSSAWALWNLRFYPGEASLGGQWQFCAHANLAGRRLGAAAAVRPQHPASQLSIMD